MRTLLKFPLFPAFVGFVCAAACSQQLDAPHVNTTRVGASASGGATAASGNVGSGGSVSVPTHTGGASSQTQLGGAASVVPTATGGAAALAGLPCEVASLLAAKCAACHSGSLPNVPRLLSPADFQLPAKIGGTLGEASVTQMASGVMPPAPPPASAAEQKAFSDWVAAGAKPTTCGAPPPVLPPDPYATPVTCTSKKQWTLGDHGSKLMRPGGACISCHAMTGDAPMFALGGTVYPSAHEPDDCNGSAAASVTVIVTDANGMDHSLPVNDAGNFSTEASIPFPYTARVEASGKVRAMVAKQMDGDCNGCHSESGANGAPGRIMAP